MNMPWNAGPQEVRGPEDPAACIPWSVFAAHLHMDSFCLSINKEHPSSVKLTGEPSLAANSFGSFASAQPDMLLAWLASITSIEQPVVDICTAAAALSSCICIKVNGI